MFIIKYVVLLKEYKMVFLCKLFFMVKLYIYVEVIIIMLYVE